MDSRKKIGVEDFIMLSEVTEDQVMKNLQERHAQDTIYVWPWIHFPHSFLSLSYSFIFGLPPSFWSHVALLI